MTENYNTKNSNKSNQSNNQNQKNNRNNNEKKLYGTYNPTNILIEPEDVQLILAKGGITETINDISLWRKAFVHKSYSKNRNFSTYTRKGI